MKAIKRIFAIAMVTVLCFGLLLCPAYAENGEISVYLNGAKIAFDVKPQMINSRTMVPIRAIFEAMGAVVEWDGVSRSAICQKGNTVVRMTVGSMDMYINDTLVSMDIAPVILDGRTLAPARFVAEAFGGTVTWDGQTRTVGITLVENKLVTLYSLDGQAMQVLESEISAYLKKGWSTSPDFSLQTLYAPDGRTVQVYRNEVPLYLNVGWYETPEAASQAYHGATQQAQNQSGGNNQSDYYTDDGTYKTPGGSQYHFDQACAGSDSYRTRLEDVKRAGLTPCPNCAW